MVQDGLQQLLAVKPIDQAQGGFMQSGKVCILPAQGLLGSLSPFSLPPQDPDFLEQFFVCGFGGHAVSKVNMYKL